MPHSRLCAFAIVAFIGAILWDAPARAADPCIHPWAKPGEYTVSGSFQGRIRSITTKLTKGCRIIINFPGVFTGGPVTRAGSCVRFSFKVSGEPQTLTGRWCNGYAIIPYNGHTFRANVYQTPRQARGA